MKKAIWILAAALAVATGCKKNGTDTGKENLVIGSSEHTITFTIDTPVEIFWVTDAETSQTFEGILNEETQTITCEGAWFSAEVNLASSKEIILTVDENTSEKDRDLIISAYYKGRSGSTVITQEAE